MNDTGPSAEASFLNDMFISYSRKESAFAAILEATLERYKPPKYLHAPQRRLTVFRDAEDFTGTEYGAAIARHLEASRKLIVICSPNARRSAFVNDEIRRFARTRAATDIIPVLVMGIPNNEAKSASDDELAFPDALLECLPMPLACDYRGFDPKSDRDPAGKKFRQEWFKLLANFYGCTRAEIEERELRRGRQVRVRWAAASISIASLLAATLGFAEFQRRTAKSEEVAAQSMQQGDRDPEQALRLAIEAVEQRETKLSTSALRLALARAPDLLMPLTVRAPKDADDYVEPPPLDFAPDGARLAVADNSPRIIELQTGRAIVKIAGEGKSFAKVRFSPDGGWLAAIDEERKTVVFDAATGKAATRIDGELYWRASPKGDAQQAAVLFDQAVETGELDRSGTWRSSRRLTPQDYSPQARDDENFSAARELSPDGHNIATLVTRNDVSQLTVTSLDTGKPLSRALGAPAGLSKLVWSPRGAYLAAVSLFGFHVVDTRSLKTAAQTDSGLEITVEDAAFDPGEALLATTDRGGQVILWDIAKNAKAATLSGPGERVYDPIFSASGDLLSAHYGNTSRVLLFAVSDAMQASDPEVSTKPLATFDPIWGGAKVARFTRDGSGLVIVYEGRKLAFWRTGHWRWRHRLPLQYEARYEAGIPEGLRDLRVTADGAAIGVMSGGNWRGWNIVSGKETSDSAKGLRTLDKFTLSEFGQLKLRVDASEETTANLEDRSDGRQKYPLQHSAQVMSKAFSPDGSCILTTSRFYSASGDPPENADVARLWDTETGALMREWSFGYGNPDSALFAGSDHIVVLSGGEALVYETPLCQPLDSLRQQARIRVPSP